MASAAEKLAGSLEELEAIQSKGVVAIRSSALSRTHRERLVKSGFLKEVMRGWNIPSRPDEVTGESTAWYTSFWQFCAQYLSDRFGEDWSLSPEQSLIIHAGDTTVPPHLLVRATKGGNSKTDLPHNTSLFETRATIATGDSLLIIDELRVFSPEDALIHVPEAFFRSHPTEARTVLAVMPDASQLLGKLLDGGHTRAAGRLAGAFRSIGSGKIADEILSAMKAASHDVREVNPFEHSIVVPNAGRVTSPHVHRIRLTWARMREDVIDLLPKAQPIANAYRRLSQTDRRDLCNGCLSLALDRRVSGFTGPDRKSPIWNLGAKRQRGRSRPERCACSAGLLGSISTCQRKRTPRSGGNERGRHRRK